MKSMCASPKDVERCVTALCERIGDVVSSIDYTSLPSKVIAIGSHLNNVGWPYYDLSGIPHYKFRGIYESLVGLPSVSCIYFVCDTTGELLYIGRAANLNQRWRMRVTPHGEFRPEINHKCIVKIICEGGPSLVIHWWKVPREHHATYEMSLIQSLNPKWNSHRR